MIQNEPIATRRILKLFLYDAAGNGKTGVSRAGGATVQIHKKGGAFVNSANDLVDIGKGGYELQLTQAETDTAGPLWVSVVQVGVIHDDLDVVDIEPVTDCLRYFLAAGGDGTHIFLDANANNTVADYYAGSSHAAVVAIIDGPGAGQARFATAYDQTNGHLTVTPAWGTNPTGASSAKLYPMTGQLTVDQVTAINVATLAAIATVQADTDDIQTRIPAALDGSGFMKAQVKGMDAAVETAIAAAVWDLTTVGHFTAGSFGELMMVVAALNRLNSRVDNTVFGTNTLLTSCRIRTFASAAACNAGVDGHANDADSEIMRFAVSAVDEVDNGKWSGFKLTRTL